MKHITNKDNVIANILSKAQSIGKEEMTACEDEKDGDKKTYGYSFAIEEMNCKDRIEIF